MTQEQINSQILYPEHVYNKFGLKQAYMIELPGVIVYSIDRDKCIFKAKKIWAMLQETNLNTSA